MAIGVSPARICPDQSESEAARKAYVAAALADRPKTEAVAKRAPVAQQSVKDKLRADEALRIAGGFTRGGHR